MFISFDITVVKLLNSVSFNKSIYKDLIMANLIKEDVKKNKKITCPYGHNFSYLQKLYLL